MTVTFHGARAPEGLRLYAIGDVHGRLDLLRLMHERIRADLDKRPARDWRIVHLGDYIDRGPDSRGVLDFLIEAGRRDARVLSLVGNHDEGLLHYLALGEPESVFGRHGGDATARSYGVELDFSSPEQVRRSQAAMVAATPAAHADFIRSLPRAFAFGDFFFCHAGVRPGAPLDAQDPEDLIWIRTPFLEWQEPYEKVVVHGHTPRGAVDIRPNRVNLDTYAWKSGVLSAIAIDGPVKRLIEARL